MVSKPRGIKTYGDKYRSGYDVAEPFTRKKSAPATLVDNQLKQLIAHNPDELKMDAFKPSKRLKQEQKGEVEDDKTKKVSLQTMVKKKINNRITHSNIVFDHFNVKAEPEKTRAATNRTNI